MVFFSVYKPAVIFAALWTMNLRAGEGDKSWLQGENSKPLCEQSVVPLGIAGRLTVTEEEEKCAHGSWALQAEEQKCCALYLRVLSVVDVNCNL